MTKNNITALELSFIIFLITIVSKLHAVPCLLAGYSDESLWISALINFVIDGILLVIVIKILNKTSGKDIYELLTQKCGKFLGKVICFLFVIFMLAKTIIPIIEQKNSVALTFYETQPSLYTFIPVYVIIFYLAFKGLWSFAKSVNIVIWGFLVGIIIVILLSFSATRLFRILPLFNKPFNTVFNGSFKTMLWFGDPLYLLFFSKHVEKTKNFNKKLIFAYILSVLIYIGGLIIFYSVFEGIAVRQYFAPLKMSKYSVTLSNIGRFDYIATLLIITANVYQLALPIIIAAELLSRVFDIKNKYVAPLITTCISLTITLFTQYGFYSHLAFMQNYGIWFLIFMTYITPIIIAVILKKPVNLKEKQ